MQQALNFLPLPQGQGSFRPILSGRETPQVGGEFMFLYHPSCRFDTLEAKLVEQRLAQIQTNGHIGFAWQKPKHSLNGRIQVNLAEQITGPEPEISGGTRELVAHGGNNGVAAILARANMLWSARKLYGWPKLPTSGGLAACNRISPARFAISGCSHLQASWQKPSPSRQEGQRSALGRRAVVVRGPQ
jgi:hypothetical protein